jgi:sec-independent protein translocase protein TatB
MFDIGWTELVLIGVVALIVIGPKDLPEMFRTLGRFTAKLRSMSREFQRAMETAAKDSGVKDVAKDIKSIASPGSLGLNAVKDAASKFEKWDPLKSSRPAAPVATPAKPETGISLPAGHQAVVPPPEEPIAPVAAVTPAKPAPKRRTKDPVVAAAPVSSNTPPATPRKPRAKKAQS